MRLDAEPPFWMGEAIGDRRLDIESSLGRALVHGLKQEMSEVEAFEHLWLDLLLRIDQLELIARALLKLNARLRAHADPVDGARHEKGAVGLDGDLESCRVECRYQRLVDLQHRLTACKHDKGRRAAISPPGFAAGSGERIGIGEFAAAIAVRSDEVGVAEIAGRGLAVSPAAGPQIAAGKAAEHGRPAGLRAFALQRIENLLDRVHGRNLALRGGKSKSARLANPSLSCAEGRAGRR
jgi:hypothetical protein